MKTTLAILAAILSASCVPKAIVVDPVVPPAEPEPEA